MAGKKGTPTIEELQAEIARLKSSRTTISLKVSEKGALSVYGMGRFPVTLYKEQWQKLSEAMPQLLEFIEEHDGELKTKGD